MFFGDTISADVRAYLDDEIKLQNTVGPSVASWYGGPLAGAGAGFVQKEFHRSLTPEQEIAVSNPGVGVPVLVAKSLHWL